MICLIQCVSSVAVLSTAAVTECPSGSRFHCSIDAFLRAGGATECVWCVSECVVCGCSCSLCYVGQVADMKQRCNYAYIGIAVSHFADRILEAVPTRAMASSFLRFLDHTQRGITFGRAPLDERSARSRDLYLKTHNIHNRQTSVPRRGSNPQS